MDIRFEHTFNVRYRGLRLVPTARADRELLRLGLSLDDCREILEHGYEARKRRRDTIERWFDVGHKTYNVVAAQSYNWAYREEVWLIIHAGMFTRKPWRKP